MVFCGLDIGTTNTKAVVLDCEGNLLDCVSIVAAEQRDAKTWYEHFCQVLDYFASRGHFSGQEISCSVTAQGGTFVLLSDNFNPVSPAYSWTAKAGSGVVEDLADCFGEQKYYHLTGWEPGFWLAVCKLRELVRDGDIPENARFVASVPDFIYSQMTGELITDITNAQITGIADFDKAQWSVKVADWTGIEHKSLPPISDALEVVFDKVQTKWGKVSFVTSSHDQYAAMQAAGLEPDRGVMLGTGTAWVINGRSNKAVYDDENFLIHPGRDLYRDCFGYIVTLGQTGRGFDRLIERFGLEGNDLGGIESTFGDDELPCKAIEVDVLSGEIASESNASLTIRRYMEWAGSVVAFVLERFELTSGQGQILMSGGAAKSRFWPQVIADICGITVQAIDFPEFTAYGAALHAMAGASGKMNWRQLPGGIEARIYEPKCAVEYRQWYLEHQKASLTKSLRTIKKGTSK
ncbi:MAG: FGGY family carbohydrate kinase [Planctomycetota bacterium]|jgi:sugar (pentulose or hexulose) kinase